MALVRSAPATRSCVIISLSLLCHVFPRFLFIRIVSGETYGAVSLLYVLLGSNDSRSAPHSMRKRDIRG